MQAERDAERDRMRFDALPLVCPVCNFFFMSWEVTSFGYETRRTDFRPNYEGENPMKLYYHFCPSCKFCADQEYFRLEIPREARRALEEGAARLFKELGEGLSTSVARNLFFGAHVAELLQHLGLIKESEFDRAQSFVQAFWWSDPSEMAAFGEAAVERLRKALPGLERSSENYLYALYMVGEISRRMGNAGESRLHFEKLLGLRAGSQNESNRFIFELARQQMTEPRDIMPEESLNPYKRG